MKTKNKTTLCTIDNLKKGLCGLMCDDVSNFSNYLRVLSVAFPKDDYTHLGVLEKSILNGFVYTYSLKSKEDEFVCLNRAKEGIPVFSPSEFLQSVEEDKKNIFELIEDKYLKSLNVEDWDELTYWKYRAKLSERIMLSKDDNSKDCYDDFKLWFTLTKNEKKFK